MSEKRKQPNTNNSKITIITEEEIRKMYSSEVPRDYSHNKRKRKSYEKKFKFETVQEYMDSVITWKRLGSKRDVPHDTIRKWKSQVIKMYQDPSISALNREGNTILWDWIKKHLVMEGDEKTYPEIRTNLLQIEYGVWMKHRSNILTLQKKSFKLRNSSSFSKTHGFNQRDTLVACIRADGARLAPMIIETRNAYLNKKKDSSKSREKIGGMSEDFMIFWLEYFSQFTQKGDILILDNLSSHKTKLVIEKARKLFINLIFTPPKRGKKGIHHWIIPFLEPLKEQGQTAYHICIIIQEY
ncbi:hypothetical protein M0812_14855 [Anaeramoeba flamelloides]|uniref:DDE-1 domain-containing protein n=1 Tax=Anaeramoeba flamelloides TaxID=1746091 RepID=A0AAV7ZEF7_9EUKA|nr:hypothetical protein M0812_14855 [Anaeramoeba flamelloides]